MCIGKPPVGELRFQKPQPAAKWDGVYNATVFRTACMQPDQLVPDNNIPETSHKGEDCLFLSVYRPSIKSDKPRPVMMWVHGGGFETGSIFTIAYDASYIVTRGDVIVVCRVNNIALKRNSGILKFAGHYSISSRSFWFSLW